MKHDGELFSCRVRINFTRLVLHFRLLLCNSVVSSDTQVRCWEVQDNGQTVPKAQQMHTGPVLDVCWSDVSL